jgi:hypothetical protein
MDREFHSASWRSVVEDLQVEVSVRTQRGRSNWDGVHRATSFFRAPDQVSVPIRVLQSEAAAHHQAEILRSLFSSGSRSALPVMAVTPR